MCAMDATLRNNPMMARYEYTPPTRETILEFQSHQEFPIILNAHDPDAGNVYKDLRFPTPVYKHIEEYYEEKATAEHET